MHQINFFNVSPLSGNYCGSGLKGKEEVLNKKPLVQKMQKREMEKKQFKKEPRGLECYRRRCKQEDHTYIHIYIYIYIYILEREHNLYLQEARTIIESLPKSVV